MDGRGQIVGIGRAQGAGMLRSGIFDKGETDPSDLVVSDAQCGKKKYNVVKLRGKKTWRTRAEAQQSRRRS